MVTEDAHLEAVVGDTNGASRMTPRLSVSTKWMPSTNRGTRSVELGAKRCLNAMGKPPLVGLVLAMLPRSNCSPQRLLSPTPCTSSGLACTGEFGSTQHLTALMP